MIFEGIEKKFEVLISDSHPSFRDRGEAFWEGVVRRSNATILSRVTNEYGTAYLLSESSLFVYDRQVIMITCGRTTLVDSLLEVLDHVDLDQVRSVIYERKNENFPGMQLSDFTADARRLAARVPGQSLLFGDPHDHHLWVFHLDRPHTPERGDQTLELLMYGLEPEVGELFMNRRESSEEIIHRRTGLDSMLPGFTVDDHLFDPFGYSLNAIRGRSYYTVHVTPQDPGSYASFETNHPLEPGELRHLLARTVSVFNPERFDVILFENEIDLSPLAVTYRLGQEARRRLDCGYEVRFFHFVRGDRWKAGTGPSGSRSDQEEAR